MPRLRTVSAQDPGWRRTRWGRGFRYLDEAGNPLSPEQIRRAKALVIPPAWTEVWICPHERGHLQAVGTDAAGRRQYLYHPAWRERRDAEKFDRVLTMARKLPAVRRRVRRALDGDPTARETVLAAAIRLIDLGLFRPGAEEYAEENGSYGLLTLERRHVRRDAEELSFCFVAKAGVEQEVTVRDAVLSRVVAALVKGRPPDGRLLATEVDGQWRPVEPAELNDRLRELFGMDVTAKDFRTWHATVTVAAALAATDRAESRRGRAKQVRAAVTEAAEQLGNTVAIARSSYVDPRVIDLFEDGRTVRPTRSRDQLERNVVDLLTN